MIVKFVDGFREQCARILPLRYRRLLGAEQKYFVHADVQRISAKRIEDLVQQAEDDGPDLRVKRIPFAAIDAVVVRKRTRREIELRIVGQQRKRFCFPRLMAQRLKLRNQPDVLLLAERRKPARAVFGNWIRAVAQLGMRFEGEVVIDLEDDDVDSLLRERRQSLPERVE